jgi:hypothetical protein
VRTTGNCSFPVCPGAVGRSSAVGVVRAVADEPRVVEVVPGAAVAVEPADAKALAGTALAAEVRGAAARQQAAGRCAAAGPCPVGYCRPERSLAEAAAQQGAALVPDPVGQVDLPERALRVVALARADSAVRVARFFRSAHLAY